MSTDVRYLADTSAIVVLSRPEVAVALGPLVAAGQVATCAVIDLELFALVHDPAELARIRAWRALAFHWLPTTDDDLRRALEVQGVLSGTVPWPKLVVAAVAERHGVPVLHCDGVFAHIAAYTGQDVLELYTFLGVGPPEKV